MSFARASTFPAKTAPKSLQKAVQQKSMAKAHFE
jgi:hypothetical protein